MAKADCPNPQMGARARARREYLGIKKNELALALDIGTSRLSQMEIHGVDRLSLVTRWAEVLEMSAAELAFGKGKR